MIRSSGLEIMKVMVLIILNPFVVVLKSIALKLAFLYINQKLFGRIWFNVWFAYFNVIEIESSKGI